MTTMTNNNTNIDFNEIVNRANNGERITVKHLAREYKMKSADLKTELVNHFGARIQFRRGRTGGIVFTA
jgi:hypothetical protein